MGKRRQLALDTNIILDLGAAKDFAHEFRELAISNQVGLWVPPKVVEETLFLTNHTDSDVSAWAHNALANILDWKIQPFVLTDVELHIAEEFSEYIRHKGCIPVEERNDGVKF